MRHLVCVYCMADKGLEGKNLDECSFNSDEEFMDHIESEHHMPIQRCGETDEQCMNRFSKKYPDAGKTRLCKCPGCKNRRRLLNEMIKEMMEVN